MKNRNYLKYLFSISLIINILIGTFFFLKNLKQEKKESSKFLNSAINKDEDLDSYELSKDNDKKDNQKPQIHKPHIKKKIIKSKITQNEFDKIYRDECDKNKRILLYNRNIQMMQRQKLDLQKFVEKTNNEDAKQILKNFEYGFKSYKRAINIIQEKILSFLYSKYEIIQSNSHSESFSFKIYSF